MPAFQQERCRVFWLAETALATALDQKRLYFVDESSLTSTNQMKEFLNRLTPQDRVVLVGDVRQHQAVEAAGRSSNCKMPG